MTNFKNILVTGGCGCIGSALVNTLHRSGFNVTLFDLPEQIIRSQGVIDPNIKKIPGSILDESSLSSALDGIEVVVHLAGFLGVKNTEENLYRCYEINVKGTENVLNACVRKRVNKFLFASSSEVYGEPLENPIEETTPTQGKSFYAITKMMGEGLCRSFSQENSELNYTIFRFFNTYGINQVGQFVIPKFIYNAQNTIPITINGDGSQLRSYCYSYDTAKAIQLCINNINLDKETINIGNSKDFISLTDLANLIIDRVGSKTEIIYDKNFSNTDRDLSREIYYRFCSGKKAESVLGFTSEISLKEGIDEVIKNKIEQKWSFQ